MHFSAVVLIHHWRPYYASPILHVQILIHALGGPPHLDYESLLSSPLDCFEEPGHAYSSLQLPSWPKSTKKTASSSASIMTIQTFVDRHVIR